MHTKDNIMDIIYIFDNNYFPIAIVSLLSLIQNYKGNALVIHLVCTDVTINNKNILLSYETSNIKILIYDFNIEQLENLPDTVATKNTYIRLFLADIIKPTSNHILYIDCDTLIRDDISSLEMINMNGKVLGMVPDFIPSSYITLITSNTYYNAGVILFEKTFFLQQEYQKRINHFLQNKDLSSFRFADQDILNNIFHNEIFTLDLKYNCTTPLFLFKRYKSFCQAIKNCNNYLTKTEFINTKTNPIIIHFSGNMLIRPWFKNSKHPFAKEYQVFLEKNKSLPKYKFKIANKIDSILHSLLPNWIYSKIYSIEINFLFGNYIKRIKGI
jgi:lipopolysaccharide biosynthesis glycosyltransferase